MNCTECQHDLMAYLEGALYDAPAHEVDAHLAACPECKADYDWFVAAGKDFEALGDEIVRDLPAIDIVEAVMAEVEREAAEEAQKSRSVVSFEAEKERRSGLRWVGVAAAAGVVVAVAAWVMYERGFFTPSNEVHIAQDPETTAPPDRDPGQSESPGGVDGHGLEEDAPDMRPGERTPVESVAPVEVTIPDLAVNEIVSAYLDAHADDSEEALAKLNRWASLAQDDAKVIASDADASAYARAGASTFLDDTEASIQLMTVVGDLPDDPAVRMKLVNALRSQTGQDAATQAQLDTLTEIDPDNALVDYMLALELLEAGDVEAALRVLEQAQAKTTAETYARDNAVQRREALTASGMNPENAEVLAALTAGQEEYSELRSLANELLSYGRFFEEQGDSETAARIIAAVNSMGAQVADGAMFSQEQMAGFDIQQEALGITADPATQSSIQALLESADDPLDYVGVITELATGVEGLGNVVNQVLTTLASNSDEAGAIAAAILREGDIAFVRSQGQN